MNVSIDHPTSQSKSRKARAKDNPRNQPDILWRRATFEDMPALIEHHRKLDV